MRFLKLNRILQSGCFVGAGEALCPMIYVDDPIDGILLGATADNAVVDSYTLTGRKPTSVARLVEIIAEKVGGRPPRLRVPFVPLPQAVRKHRFDAKVDLPTGIERTVTCYRGTGYLA